MTHTVFVYGSLLSGLHNHHYLSEAEALGAAQSAAAAFTMIDLGTFPGAYAAGPDEPAGRLTGELYAVTDDQLAALDRLESNGSFYQRERRYFVTADGRRRLAWVYFLISRHYSRRRVTDGDWRAHRCLPKPALILS